MSLYFFHVQDGSTTLDAEGLDFPDLDSARYEAICSCGELLREVPPAIWKGETLHFWVTDQPDGTPSAEQVSTSSCECSVWSR